MSFQDFVFSNYSYHRIIRHAAFWCVIFFEKYLTGVSYYLQGPNELSRMLLSIPRVIPEITLYMLYCYLVVYWLVPKYFIKKKYIPLAVHLLAFTVLIEVVRLYFMGFNFDIPKEQRIFLLWMKSTNIVNTGPHVTCIIFLSIKIIKSWYAKEEEKTRLIQEQAAAELQLLKSQIHPHFLFNTLNNIYSFVLDQSPQAPALVQRLSAVLKYMIHDAEAARITLEKELRMIDDYISLEKVRYGDRLNLQIEIRNEPGDEKLIVPLLLIPLIENCFKHGASQIIDKPWVRLKLEATDNQLRFELRNGKPDPGYEMNGKKGIGLANLRKRLQLIYPKKHELEIRNMEKEFMVVMVVPLEPWAKVGTLVSKDESDRIVA